MSDYVLSEEAMIHKDKYDRRSSIYDWVKLALFSLVVIGIGVIIFFLIDQQQRDSRQTDEILDCTITTGKCYQDHYNLMLDEQNFYCQGIGFTTYSDLERCTLETFSREYQGAK